MNPATPNIKPREREAIIRSLRSGVVPSAGLRHIQVGRHREVASLLRDIDAVAAGGAAMRIVVGEYGSGKTFLLTLVKGLALERGLCVMQADLSPEKRLQSAGGHARRLLQELVESLSTRTKRDGQGLSALLERFATQPEEKRAATLARLAEMPSGPAFAAVVGKWVADPALRPDCHRWLSAAMATRTDSMRALGVREILGDADLMPALRLYAALARGAGYGGLWVNIDEAVNLYKIANAQARRANYELLLSLLNNTLQGNVEGLGVAIGATPEMLTDPHRGLYSYEALRSRLAENTLSASTGLADYDSTVLRLPQLTREELFVLLRNLRAVWGGDMAGRVPDGVLEAYLRHCFERIGESYFRTPRTTVKGFLDLLALLDQHPEATAAALLPSLDVAPDREPSDLADLAF